MLKEVEVGAGTPLISIDQSTRPGVAMHSDEPNKVDITAVSKIFGATAKTGRVVALDQVDLTIAANEFFTLLGPSGCGKTTLLRLIAGFEAPSAGEIRLDGVLVNDLPAHKRPVNTVFQNYALFPHLSIARNISFSLEMLGKKTSEIQDTVARMLDLVRLEGVADRRPAQLSGGQQQRVALARALASSPSLLLLDEPLSALDLNLRREMQGELKRIQHDTGTTFVYVTHDQEEALAMSDRIAVMSAGKIHQVGPPKDIYKVPKNLTVAEFIGDINLIEGEVTAQAGQDARARLATGGEVKTASFYDLAPGTKVKFAFRPEHVELTKPDKGLVNTTVTDLSYVGAETQVKLVTATGQEFSALLRSDADVSLAEKGASVGIRPRDGTSYILPLEAPK